MGSSTKDTKGHEGGSVMSDIVKPEWAEEYEVGMQRLLALPWQIREEIRGAGCPLTSYTLAERLGVPASLVQRVCERLREAGRLEKVGGF